MTGTGSVATPLMVRTVCDRCDHFHRHALRDKCTCCRDDCRNQPEPEQAPEPVEVAS